MSLVITISVLLVLGLGIRLVDLTDLPMDFHGARQLYSLIKVRGMYYEIHPEFPEAQREFAIHQWKSRVPVEPEVMEKLVFFTYQFTGEQIWVGRLYSLIFWVLGGFFLFLLAHNLVSEDGAVFTLAFYLLLVYGVIASRSFQPDPLMILLIITFWWSLQRWSQNPTWGWTIVAGLTGGLAIFVKLVAVFFIIGGAVGLIFGRYTFKELIRMPKLWVLAVIGALPGTAYLFYGIVISGFLGERFGGRFIPALLLDPLNYWRWARQIEIVMGSFFPFVLGILGLFLLDKKQARIFATSLWVSYFVYGLCFDYHIASHDYYSLILVPIVGFSLAAPAHCVLNKLEEAAKAPWLRIFVVLIMLFGLAVSFLHIRSELNAVDFRPQAGMWAEISTNLENETTVALTQDYGLRLSFWGWRTAIYWPSSGDINYKSDVRGGNYEFEKHFEQLTAGKRFFLITDLDDLDRQPALQDKLYKHYPIHAQGNDYLIFDLQNPLAP